MKNCQAAYTWVCALTYPESWSSVLEEDGVIVKADIDEASPKCPSRSCVPRKHTATGELSMLNLFTRYA